MRPASWRQTINWMPFDAVKGVLTCPSMGTEVKGHLCFVVHASLVRTLADPGGRVICASDNRETSGYGRRGQRCRECADRDCPCRLRWRIWVKEVETSAIFAHTLSVTASANFARYCDRLQEMGRLPGEVVTEIFVEDFKRKRTGLSYRRLQFACASDGFAE